MFQPIRTERLLIRPYTVDDLDAHVARRNDPDVARFQDWEVPYSRERGENLIERLTSMDGPPDEGWWNAIVADATTGQVYGDLALGLSWEGRTAEIGYTFDSRSWGHGYAVEAATALRDYCFDTLGVTRVCGMLHPDNVASAMVLERVGMLFEGHTRSSFWVGDELSDDWIYGMTRADRDTWVHRPRTPPDTVRLDEITTDTAGEVAKLATHKSQEQFVASMAWSFVDAMFPEVVDGAPLVPWMRAVVADGTICGFVMVALTTEHHPEPYLWRLLIDRFHQRRGIGGRVLDLLADECRAWGDSTLLTSWVEGKGSPASFYLAHGFERTGEIVDGEIEGRWRLAPPT